MHLKTVTAVNVFFRTATARDGSRYPLVHIQDHDPLSGYIMSAMSSTHTRAFRITPNGVKAVIHGRAKRYIDQIPCYTLTAIQCKAYAQESDPCGDADKQVVTIGLTDLRVLLDEWCEFVQAVENGTRKRGFSFEIASGVILRKS